MAQKIKAIKSTNEGFIQIPKYKIIILGPMGSGKTALSFRFCEDKYIETEPTLQTDYRDKIIKVNNENIMLQLWDTVGQERFAHSLPTSFYRGVDSVVFVFDTTSRQSYQQLNFWINECRKFVDSEVPMVLIGTKCDLTEAVSENEVQIFADKNNLPYFTTSAKIDEEAEHIMSIFTTLAYKIKTKRPLINPTIILDQTALIEPPQGFWNKYCGC